MNLVEILGWIFLIGGLCSIAGFIGYLIGGMKK